MIQGLGINKACIRVLRVVPGRVPFRGVSFKGGGGGGAALWVKKWLWLRFRACGIFVTFPPESRTVGVLMGDFLRLSSLLYAA